MRHFKKLGAFNLNLIKSIKRKNLSLSGYIHLAGLQMTVCLSFLSLFVTLLALWELLKSRGETVLY